MFLGLTLFFMSSCSSQKVKKEIKNQWQPKWVYSASSACNTQTELCASGEGENFTQSDLRAKKALSAIFGTKISSQFNLDRSSFNSSEINSMEESIKSNIAEEVEDVLKTASIKDRFNKKEMYFSLARVDKRKAKKVFETEINKLDANLLHYFKLKNRLNIKKMTIDYNTREKLNEKLTILSGKSIKAPVRLDQIQMLKFLGTGSERIFLSASPKFPRDLANHLENSLVELNYKVTSEKTSNFIIEMDYYEEKKYLNVGGFEKHAFLINVSAFNKKGTKIGGYNTKISASGRSKSDAREKMKSKMLVEFERNIAKLNLKN